MKNNEQPLVSVAVISYNSSKTIIETLDSIYNQTYPNIELIISDDCSTDNTLEVCREWLNTHKQRFAKARFIIPPTNTGVTGNCQRIWDGCCTEWLKSIAADDTLLPNCIADNMAFVKQHEDAECIFSKIEILGIPKSDAERFLQMRYDFSFFEKSQKDQYEQLLQWCSIPSCSAFKNVRKLKQRGINYDNRIPMLDDRPFFLNLVAAGVHFDFLDKITVGYRVHPNSLCNAPLLSPKFYESAQLTNFYYYFSYNYKNNPETAIREMVRREMTIYNDYYNLKKISNQKSYKLYKYLTNPSLILRWFKRHI